MVLRKFTAHTPQPNPFARRTHNPTRPASYIMLSPHAPVPKRPLNSHSSLHTTSPYPTSQQVAGGVALGAAVGALLTRALSARSYDTASAATSGVWDDTTYAGPSPPTKGFTLRTPCNDGANPGGVDVMMEKWDAGSSEPPHSHPGDDMTVVVEGKMSIQYFVRLLCLCASPC